MNVVIFGNPQAVSVIKLRTKIRNSLRHINLLGLTTTGNSTDTCMHFSEWLLDHYWHCRWAQLCESHERQATWSLCICTTTLHHTHANHINKILNAKIQIKKSYGVILASPVGQRTPGLTSGTFRHASRRSGPAALCMAVRINEKQNQKLYWVHNKTFTTEHFFTTYYLHLHHHLQAFAHSLHLPMKWFPPIISTQMKEIKLPQNYGNWLYNTCFG